MLAYNCSPSFNWKQHLDDATIAKFQNELGAMGYKFQFITLAGFHALNYSMFDLAHGYARDGMSAYVELQEREFAVRGARLHRHQAPARGRHRLLRPHRHHRQPDSATPALAGSTERASSTDAAATPRAGGPRTRPAGAAPLTSDVPAHRRTESSAMP